ncbi:phosphatidate cytidylyltransferase [Exophiala dermatitidis]|uniref:Phosphatidate cytidylyltransferase n=2 Tax=Exophiala dermatitidis TaxID=5970 RepID=H6C9Q0_EXODN|nr:phosphatidate cytidylyltransferase [Exophiala dermatitidis NIH/UT8656]KAJ4524894.1 phosphatidate cytidylyltransferase [Exophiala dermatitidis]EHY60766.1 phosphatidate cytidylyltransferase [Exophiala dermatitidis NIH/UT8656]KAJ4527778.1 phosphatidate cytidylyltransferase [Exophiala dermatitidis]KAJ4528414.1 phosphatidate cytidylyltransferase [Exophiala dermatitidis]KAJ4531371.1 phosphatidate cytidylyltransferase [Exophiala dermatitidis]
MPKQRSVKFQHRGNGNGQDHRRQSLSTASESTSEPPSPLKEGDNNSNRNGSLVKGEKPAEASDYEKKKATFITRTIWTIVMISGFFGAMFAGHVYVLMIITAVQIISFKEVIAIAQVPTKQKNLPLTRSLNWYFLAITMYFLYGESVIYYFKHVLLVDRVLLPFATHHRFISFMMYIFGFVFFVASLKKGHYKFQFTQFAWTHMALYLIVVQAHFMMNNVFEGMIWFFLPVSLVITNDIFAYICGITFGRTQLIKISPKKTVEGFVGAWICTLIFGFALTNLLMRYKYFICPVNDLGANFFTGLECTPNPVFVAQPYHLPEWTGLDYTLWIEPMQFHILIFATFASLIAPFGGFFASGLKRTFKIKDFGDSIPGHGGMTDRMDCQFIMGLFSYMYYQSFIAVYRTSVGAVIETAIVGLTPEEQVEVVKGLGKYLYNQGIVSDKVLQCLAVEFAKR